MTHSKYTNVSWQIAQCANSLGNQFKKEPTYFIILSFIFTGMDDMPPLEGDAEDASRMEEVD